MIQQQERDRAKTASMRGENQCWPKTTQMLIPHLLKNICKWSPRKYSVVRQTWSWSTIMKRCVINHPLPDFLFSFFFHEKNENRNQEGDKTSFTAVLISTYPSIFGESFNFLQFLFWKVIDCYSYVPRPSGSLTVSLLTDLLARLLL